MSIHLVATPKQQPTFIHIQEQAITFKLVHHPVTYPILVRMLHERQAGYSYTRIASGLSADGIPTSAADPRTVSLAAESRRLCAALRWQAAPCGQQREERRDLACQSV